MAEQTGELEVGAAALMYHRLSSYGWMDEPPVLAPGGVPNAVLDTLTVPPPDPELPAAFEAVLRRRVSRRDFTGAPVALDRLKFALWCGYGRTDGGGLEHRTTPSAGGVYPLELVVGVVNVDGARPGWYRFRPADGELEWAGPASDTGELFRTRHVPFDRAAAVVFLTADLSPMLHRYGERGYRFTLLEAGHVAQNLLLACAATGLGAVALGGFDDELTGEVLPASVAGASPLYTVVLGNVEDQS